MPDDTAPPLLAPTRTEAEAALAGAGITGQAATVLLNGSAPQRHAARIVHYRDCALAEYARATGTSPTLAVHAPSAAAAMHAMASIVLDAIGIGTVEPGLAWQHHRAFKRNNGPRQGGAAGAYASAAHAALLGLWATAFGEVPPQPLIELWPSDGDAPPHLDVSFVAGDGAGQEDLLGVAELMPDPCPVDDTAGGPIDCHPPMWLFAIAQEGLRRTGGMPPQIPVGVERGAHLRTTSPHPLDIVRFEGDMADWAALLNAVARRRRLEDIANRFDRVVREVITADPERLLLPMVPIQGRLRIREEELLRWMDEAPVGTARDALLDLVRGSEKGPVVEAALKAALTAAAGGG